MIAFGIKLSSRELDILTHLMIEWPRRLSASQLVERLYGEDEPEWPDMAIRVIMGRLRKRISTVGLGISSKRFVGYRLEFGNTPMIPPAIAKAITALEIVCRDKDAPMYRHAASALADLKQWAETEAGTAAPPADSVLVPQGTASSGILLASGEQIPAPASGPDAVARAIAESVAMTASNDRSDEVIYQNVFSETFNRTIRALAAAEKRGDERGG